MTCSFVTRNPNTAFPITVAMLHTNGVLRPSRNGDCLEYPGPVSVTFTHPLERVLSHPQRNINPFLHYFEPFWILAGRNDVAFLAKIVEKFRNFSDDGETFAAAYGYRLRHSNVGTGWESNVDQIEGAIHRLRKDPDDRRTVLQIRTVEEMWYNGKDTACNIAAALKIRDGALNLHVFNRSNDAIWGGPAGGTNHPQFTTLLEYIAGHVGCAIGRYTVTTDSMHVYINSQWDKILTAGPHQDPYAYAGDRYAPFRMMVEPEEFDHDLYRFFSDINKYIPNQLSPDDYKSRYFKRVFFPMWRTFISYKEKDGKERQFALSIAATDWQNAVLDFFESIPRLQQVPT